MKWLIHIALCFYAPIVLAQDIESQQQGMRDIGDQAQSAAAQLAEAGIQLNRAAKAQDRVKALTKTILAYETGLSAMREGLRRVALRQERLERKLKAHDKETASFIGVLQSMGGNTSAKILLHPQGPTGTTRAGMLLAELTPALNQRAQELAEQLSALKKLRAFQQDAANQLQKGLSEVQQARVSLSTAMAQRTNLPKSFTQDPVRTAILISSTKTLEEFAAGLSLIGVDEAEVIYPKLEKGTLSLPVQGVLLRKMNEADAAGIQRPGIILATHQGALVHAPAAGTLRYVGPLLDYSNVIILEPQNDVLFVFAGLNVAYGEAGQVIDRGTPLGLMGGATMGNSEDSTGKNNTQSPSNDDLGAGNTRSETLYIEVRQENVPQDPVTWFRTDKEN